MSDSQRHLKLWELSLLCALCVTLCASVWTQGESEKISDSLIRLHVLAVSDEAEEQEIKLRVRDAVLDCLRPKLEQAADQASARELLRSSLDEIQSAALSASEGREVSVTLTRERYPTRTYGTFSLPAGEYDSLRVILGAGEGHNWWCVVFPPLCLEAGSCEELEEAVGEDCYQILTADGHTALRFRLLEIWGSLASGRQTQKS